MARSGNFAHNPNYVAQLQAWGSSNATAFSENVSYGQPSADATFNAYMASAAHRQNILSPRMRHVGIGSVRNTAGVVYLNFVDAETGSYGSPRVAGDYFGGAPTARPLAGTKSVAAVRTAADSVLAFVRGTDGALWYRAVAANGQFSGWAKVGGGLRYGPAAVSWDGQTVHVFVTGTDGALWQVSSRISAAGLPSGWGAWIFHGGVLSSGPGAASTANGQLSVSARGSDGAVYQKTWIWSGWTAWVGIGGDVVTSPPSRPWKTGGTGSSPAPRTGTCGHESWPKMAERRPRPGPRPGGGRPVRPVSARRRDGRLRRTS